MFSTLRRAISLLHNMRLIIKYLYLFSYKMFFLDNFYNFFYASTFNVSCKFFFLQFFFIYVDTYIRDF